MTVSSDFFSLASRGLAYWRLLEAFAPQGLPKRNTKNLPRVDEWNSAQQSPWDPKSLFACSQAKRSAKKRQHTVYAGLYYVAKLHEVLNGFFPPDKNAFQERDTTRSAICKFCVDDSGAPIVGSFVLSSAAWSVGCLLKQNDARIIDNAKWVDDFDFAHEVQKKAFDDWAGAWLIKRREMANEEQEKASTPSPVLLGTDLDIMLHRLITDLGCRCLFTPKDLAVPPEAVYLISSANAPKSSETSTTDLFMNSFFLRDLERVRMACLSNAVGPVLHEYLMPDASLEKRRLDVRKPGSLPSLLSFLNPARFPKGAWPSNGKHPLVFSQQVAVNEIYQQLFTGPGLFAVNGPPGTGKTTLLRDIVAAVIVERAKLIADGVPFFSSYPEPAWDNGRYPARVAPVDPRFHGFEIVVASSNNGAVENVTTEIPGNDAVDPFWLTKDSNPNYFPELASSILSVSRDEDGTAAEMKEPVKAWAMLAAPLGNSTNRSRFIFRFWLPEPSESKSPKVKAPGIPMTAKHSAPPLSFKELLKDREAFPDFAQTKAKFVNACAKEERIRSVVVAAYGAHASISAAEQNVVLARKGLDTARNDAVAVAKGDHPTIRALTGALIEAKNRRDDAAELHTVAQSRYDLADAKAARSAANFEIKKARVSVHEQHKPCLMEIVCTLGYVLFAHRKILMKLQASKDLFRIKSGTDKTLADRLRTELNDVAANLKRCNEDQRDAAQKLDEFRKQIDRTVRDKAKALEDTTSLLAKRKEALAAFRHEHPEQYPDFVVLMQDVHAREKASPWLTREWYDARCEVFLAALELHKAYIGTHSEEFSRNLSAMADVLLGSAPAKPDFTDAVANAWRTLFFVIPVISTTFASFDRLFSHLGRESLGWLLIDEAGQAPPYAAVGALWRAQRAVIVGDPLQLEPIVTVPYPFQKAVQKYPSFNLDDTWVPKKTSVQRRADATMALGTLLRPSRNSSEMLWVGAPLRVHRRCDDPMFRLSNEIAYENMMVFGKKRLDKPYSVNSIQTSWIDVAFTNGGDSNCNPREIDEACRLLQTLRGSNLVDITKHVFLLSPFRDTANELTDLGKQFNISSKRAGTIHTAQGKEADIVILVLGGSTVKARKWAAESPNLLNVAATRAKKILIVIGSRQNWAALEYFNTASKLILPN